MGQTEHHGFRYQPRFWATLTHLLLLGLAYALFAGRKPVREFRYRDMGALVSLADYDAFGSLGQFGLFHGQTFRGRLAQISHVMLYRTHQARIHGFWKGGLLWLVDRLNSRVRAPIRLD